MAPWGGLLLAEDNYGRSEEATHQYIRGLDPSGQVYDIARNRQVSPKSKRAGAEFTGVCFSPDGKYLFVNLQAPISATLAIRGPWSRYTKA